MKSQVLAKSIGSLNRKYQAYITVALKDTELSFSEHVFLVNLAGNEGINQEELSFLLCIDKAATARGIKLLEKKGLLIRKSNNIDKREKQLYLTDKGKIANESYCIALRKWMIYHMQDMSHEVQQIVLNGLHYIEDRARHADFQDIINIVIKPEDIINDED